MSSYRETCSRFVPEGLGGRCGIPGSPIRPKICTEFYCGTARNRIAAGLDPCKNCTTTKMAEEGCCVGTDVGLGVNGIEVARREESHIPQPNGHHENLADKLLSGELTLEEVEAKL